MQWPAELGLRFLSADIAFRALSIRIRCRSTSNSEYSHRSQSALDLSPLKEIHMNHGNLVPVHTRGR